MMPKNDRRAAVDAGTINIVKYPVHGPFIGLLSYSRVNTPTANPVTIPLRSLSNKPAPLSFLIRHLRQLSAVLLVCSTTSTVAAQGDAELAAIAEMANVAMECALIAATAAPGTEEYADVGRLVAVALPNMKLVGETMISRYQAATGAEADALGPFAPMIKSMTPEFYMGLSFAQWSNEIEDLMNTRAGPNDSGDFNLWWARRQVEAELEYHSRNCRLIGR